MNCANMDSLKTAFKRSNMKMHGKTSRMPHNTDHIECKYIRLGSVTKCEIEEICVFQVSINLSPDNGGGTHSLWPNNAKFKNSN